MRSVLSNLTRSLAATQHLTTEEVRVAVDSLVDETISAEQKAEFLCGLAIKGETVDEIAAFANALREKAVQPPIDAQTESGIILDVCGTGGDRLNTFNISTTVALVCAAAGVTVAKHGNRAITSQAGSADVLEALGINIELTPAEAARALRERKFTFFFAPNYHPAFKHIAAARKLCAGKGQRTIFNFLGPLLNPARPNAQLVGVPRPELCEPLGKVLQCLGVRRGMVVSGAVAGQGLTKKGNAPTPAASAGEGEAAGHRTEPTNSEPRCLDELSILGSNTICEFYQERGFASSVLEPESFPCQSASLSDLAGGDRNRNAEIVRSILNGSERGPKRDAVLLNSAAALFVANRTQNLAAGWELAAQTIDGGQAFAKLKELAG
jgi:anthranilate phosphoribosyltransferase